MRSATIPAGTPVPGGSAGFAAFLRGLTCVLSAVLFAYCIRRTLHWQVNWDQAVIRYIRFLMSRGFRPYSDIADMNMPGCYLAEVAGTAVFGWSDPGWRIYEYCLLIAITVAGMVIGGRRLWFTGVVAGLLFMVVRLADGEQFSMERNEVMVLLELAGVACLFAAVRHRRPALAGVFGLLAGFAATMKPGGLLIELLLLPLLIVTLRREAVPVRNFVLWVLAANLVVGASIAVFLLREHALGGFVFVMVHVWPLFRSISPHEHLLLLRAVPKWLAPTVLATVALAFLNRRSSSAGQGFVWERAMLLLGALGALIGFLLEGRANPYHRYVFVGFLVTWIGWEISVALQSSAAWQRMAGAITLLTVLGIAVPYYTHLLAEPRPEEQVLHAYPEALEADLTALGGPALQGKVECLEMIEGCLRALSVEHLVQNTGSTGDLLLFDTSGSPAVDYYHRWYLQQEAEHPADVLVLGNWWFQSDHRTFAKLDAWPQYAAYVRANYVPAAERHFGPGDAPAYRIYVRQGSAVLPNVSRLPQHVDEGHSSFRKGTVSTGP